MMFAGFDRRFALAALASLAITSGCAGGTNGSVPTAPTAAIPAHKSKPCGKGGNGGVLYTAQLYGHDLNVYSRSGQHSGLTYECTLTQGVADPNGTMATVNGWWYVANGGGENVLVYRTKKGVPVGPLASLADYDNYPTNVAVDPSRNLVAVSNISSISGGGGSVSVYLHRQAVPSRVLAFGPPSVFGAGIALSHSGDCYWGVNANANGSGLGEVLKYAKCSGSPTVVVTGIPLVGGLAFDRSDNLYYVNTASYGLNPAGIYKCKKTSACSPFSSNGFVEPTNINFDYKEKALWVADPGSGDVDEVDPSSGLIVFQYLAGTNVDAPFGVAPEPGA